MGRTSGHGCGANCTYASARGHAIVGARPYLPKDWAEDPQRRERAGVPLEVVFKTKPQLAVDLLTDLDTAGVLPAWVTGDEVYGPTAGCDASAKTAAWATCSGSVLPSPSPCPPAARSAPTKPSHWSSPRHGTATPAAQVLSVTEDADGSWLARRCACR